MSWFVRGLQIALRSVKTARGCVTKSHVADRQGQRRLNFIARMRRWRKGLPNEKWQHNETADTALNKKKTLCTQGKNSMCRENTSLRTGGGGLLRTYSPLEIDAPARFRFTLSRYRNSSATHAERHGGDQLVHSTGQLHSPSETPLLVRSLQLE